MTGASTPWYVEFFGDDYLRVYADRLTDKHTEAEVAFVERALGLKSGDAVLDLCCGQGRHAILLAKHGVRATGQDLSERYIADARRLAAEQGVDAAFVVGDMRSIGGVERYDAVINMFTAFGYLEEDADNAQVLREARRALKPGGRILIDALNREWVLANQTPEERHKREDGAVIIERRAFDQTAGRNHVTFEIVERDGARRQADGHHVRLYTLAEMRALLEEAGLAYERAYGGYDAAPYAPSSRRMIVVARKPA